MDVHVNHGSNFKVQRQLRSCQLRYQPLCSPEAPDMITAAPCYLLVEKGAVFLSIMAENPPIKGIPVSQTKTNDYLVSENM